MPVEAGQQRVGVEVWHHGHHGMQHVGTGTLLHVLAGEEEEVEHDGEKEEGEVYMM